MSEIDQLSEENTVLRREISRICEKCDNARIERDEAIRERDEARREISMRFLDKLEWQKLYAISRNWDCFKEETP